MPVPVPRINKPSAHPVIKQSLPGISTQVNSFQNLTRTLPVSPTGPPPSLGTREQWINSLPSWRRTKPRRIWEDDSRSEVFQRSQSHHRLSESIDSFVANQTNLQPYSSPPHSAFDALAPISPTSSPMRCDGDADDEMSSDSSIMDHGQYDNDSQWSANSSLGGDVDMEIRSQSHTLVGGDIHNELYFERGTFTPVFEEEFTSARVMASSPLEPVTPFGQFVDRAVAAANVSSNITGSDPALGHQYDNQNPSCDLSCCQPVEQSADPLPVAELAVSPSATAAYKKLAEPLADWVANYVWKACTTGMSLPSAFSRPNTPAKMYPPTPPSYLAASVHSLLLSTLLQPSAVFLAVWYIVRLPVFFDAVGLSPDHVKEILFRTELLGDDTAGLVREGMEASAPFKLVLLGCMLANKWLDDHTFSNKTWHLISNVPIHSLNKLESFALGMFSHDLSIPSHIWSQWLAHVISYHLSLASPSHRQPISRPSTNPHTIVRMTIEELTQAPVACNSSQSSRPEPVFLGLEERRKVKFEREGASAERGVDVLVDLDEDGPLRQEYLPKRRIGGTSIVLSSSSWNTPAPKMFPDRIEDWAKRAGKRFADLDRPLPPPAKWSPAGDEPILRERTRVSGHYLAVRPPLTNSVNPFSVSSYHNVPQAGYQSWTPGSGGDYGPVKPPSAAYAYECSNHHIEPVFNPYPFALSIPVSHARSHSLSYHHGDFQSRNHLRSHSQSQSEYWYNNMTTHEHVPANPPTAHWPVIDRQYGYLSQDYPFAPCLRVNCQTTWLKT